MSRYVFKMPDLGEGTVTAEVVEWKVKVGDMVQEDQVIAEVMTDKAAVEIPSPVTGRVLSLTGQPGEMVAVGAELIAFDTSGAAAPEPAAAAAPAAAPAAAAAACCGRETAGDRPGRRAARRNGRARHGVAGHAPQGACRRGRPRRRERHGPGRAHFRPGHRGRDLGQGRRRPAAGRGAAAGRRGDQDHRRAARDRRAHERGEAEHPAFRLRRGSGRHGARVAAPVPQRAPAEGHALADLPAVPGRRAGARAREVPAVQRDLTTRNGTSSCATRRCTSASRPRRPTG